MAVTFKDGVILGKPDMPDPLLPALPSTDTYTNPRIIGADSRTTTGAYIANRVTDKLTQVHDTIWCCRSGSAADTQAVADIVQYQLGLFSMRNGKPPTTQTAAAIFQEICYVNKDALRYVPRAIKPVLLAQFRHHCAPSLPPPRPPSPSLSS